MRCSNCKAENPDGKKFCGKCGARLGGRCPKCGAENPPDDTFCGDCGTALGAAAAPKESDTAPVRVTEAAGPENLEGERKTVTALFADIKGSMELIEDLDPEDARAIVDPALKLMIDAVHRYEGYVAQSTGDGIFAMFGAPVAHEDHPQRALYAALRMQEEVKRYAEKLRAEKGVNLQVRVGVNTGEVVVRTIKTGEGHTEYTPIGHSTSLAARLQTLAAPGSTAVSESVRKLVEGYIALKSLGPARIKGVTEPVNVYEVTGLGPLRTRLQRAVGRGLTKFVGRAREMEALKRAQEHAKAGHGQIVAAMAEPGVGKSRLFYEFKAVSQFGYMVLEAFSVLHGKASAYLPVIDLLHGYFGIEAGDDGRKQREKMNGRIVTLDPALEDARPYLFGLLGLSEGDDPLAQMDGQVKKRRTLEAIKRILLRESLNQPLMVIFEDLHWIDEQTQEFLNLLADSIGTAKILLLVNYRPEYSHQWGSKTYYTQLRLDPLGRESAEEMLAALLGDGTELAPLKRLIIERTEGTPFFMEETVQVLLDEGALVGNGTVKLTRPLRELKIPPTVQAILVSRIDRLPSDAKELLQTLAVIGREFPTSLIRAVVTKSDDELNRLLNDLQLGEFIYEQPAVGYTEYIFKHALTQEVAYNSVLMGRRKALHERIGAALETLYASSHDDHLTELAHHYGRSGNSQKAVEYLRLAGQQAVQRSANAEAVTHLTAALELLPTLPDNVERTRQELRLQVTLGVPLGAVKGHGAPDVGAVYSRARELCERIGETPQLFPVLAGLRLFYHVRGEFQPARVLGEQLLSLAQRLDDPALIVRAHRILGDTLFWLGELAAARVHLEHAIALYRPQQHRSDVSFYGYDPGVFWPLYVALLLWSLGYPDQAVKRSREALSLAQELAHPFSLAAALAFAGLLHQFRREVPIARERVEACIASRPSEGFRFGRYGELSYGVGCWSKEDSRKTVLPRCVRA